MAKIYDNILELAGNTPLLRLNGITKKEGINSEIIAKIEFINPSRSVKDRSVFSLIEDALRSGTIKQGTAVIAAAYGNTAVALAQAGAVYGFSLTIVLPVSTRIEIKKLLGGYGAGTVYVRGGLQEAAEKAADLARNSPDSFLLDLSGSESETAKAGEEILKETDGSLDYLVADEDTLRSISGSVRFLKENKPDIRIAAAVGEDYGDPSKDWDETVIIPSREAELVTAKLAATEGILAGISSGAAIAAALKLSRQEENAGKRIVVILADTGERYLSTEVFGAVLTPPDPF